MNFILAATKSAPTVPNALTTLDWCVVAGYFLLLFGLAWWIILKSRKTAKDYFLAGNSLSWFIVGASIFASNIGSEHLVGLAGSGCTDGVKMAHFELHAWCLLVLAWVFIPFFMRSKVYTMPEFLEKRFSPNARWFLSIISLVAYVVTKIAVGIFAGGVVFSVLLPELKLPLFGFELDSFWIGSILVIVLTGLYTALGGMRAVAYTEALQTLILVLGSVFVTVYGIHELGKYSEDNGTIVKNENHGSFFAGCKNLRTVCDNEKEGRDMFNLWMSIKPENVDKLTWKPVIEREKNDPKHITTQAWYFKDEKTQGSFYPWIGMLLCAPIVGLWYWCTDQYIVQRALAAKNETEARRGSIFAAFLKLLPVFIFIIPGMVCFALAYHEAKQAAQTGKVIVDEEKEIVDLTDIVNVTFSEKPEVDSMGNVYLKVKDIKADSDDCQGAFPLMVRKVLPVGLRGLVVAGLLSALMSSLAGVFNASATLFTMDFYKRFDKDASEDKLVWIGRIATAVMVLIGLAWIPIIKGNNGLYTYLQSVQSYLAPPIFAVFLLGVFVKRMNAKGALTALIVGFGLGLLRLGVDTYSTVQFAFMPEELAKKTYSVFSEGSFCWFINNVYFQYYSLFIFIVCIISMIGVSYATAAPDYEKIQGLSFGSTTAEERAESRASWSWFDVIASCVVMLCIISAYIYFAG